MSIKALWIHDGFRILESNVGSALSSFLPSRSVSLWICPATWLLRERGEELHKHERIVQAWRNCKFQLTWPHYGVGVVIFAASTRPQLGANKMKRWAACTPLLEQTTRDAAGFASRFAYVHAQWAAWFLAWGTFDCPSFSFRKNQWSWVRALYGILKMIVMITLQVTSMIKKLSSQW